MPKIKHVPEQQNINVVEIMYKIKPTLDTAVKIYSYYKFARLFI